MKRALEMQAGIYRAETARTIDANGGNPGCNQGGICIVAPAAYSFYPQMKAESQCFTEETANCIVNGTNAGYQNGVVQPYKPYAMSKDSHFTRAEDKDVANPLYASDYKVPQIVKDGNYIVRRLTPTECARLQGFPDWWCEDLGTDEPSEDEMFFWRGVFDTYARINNTKPKTDNQILKWLKDPHTDAAEYKMWGNGVALPCVWFVLAGIVWAESEDDAD